jgi:hypothetical protein
MTTTTKTVDRYTVNIGLMVKFADASVNAIWEKKYLTHRLRKNLYERRTRLQPDAGGNSEVRQMRY